MAFSSQEMKQREAGVAIQLQETMALTVAPPITCPHTATHPQSKPAHPPNPDGRTQTRPERRLDGSAKDGPGMVYWAAPCGRAAGV